MPGFIKVDQEWKNVEYEEKLIEYFREHVPEKVFDAHSHISKWEIEGVPADEIFEYAYGKTDRILGGGKLKGGLTMGNPYDYETQEEYEDDRRFSCENANKHEGFVTGLLVRPEDSPEDVEKWLKKYPRIVALKPYWVYARADHMESDILDFAPEWIWELADKWGLVVVLHLSHYVKMLSNEKNAEQIRYLCKKYPNMVMQLAHCALGHNPYMFKNGLKCLEGLDNVWMDISGVGEALTIIYALRDFDRKKLMYGSDGYNFGHNLYGRCFGIADAFSALYTGTPIPGLVEPPYRFKGVETMTEGLVATFAAGDIVGLTREEYEDLFYNNAARLYYSRIRE